MAYLCVTPASSKANSSATGRWSKETASPHPRRRVSSNSIPRSSVGRASYESSTNLIEL